MPMTETAREALQTAISYEESVADSLAQTIAILRKRVEEESLRYDETKKRIEELKAALQD